MDAAVVPVFLSPRLFKFVPVSIIPGGSTAVSRAPVVRESAPAFFPLLTSGATCASVFADVSIGEGIRPLDATAVTIPLFSPFVSPSIAVTVVRHGSIGDGTLFCARTVHAAVPPIVFIPNFVPFRAVRLGTPFVCLSHDVLRRV